VRLGSSYDGGRWLVPLFLLIGVLVPTVCVLWFLNVAVNNQRDASRRKLTEAYRGQLRLLRDRADAFWEKRAADLEAAGRDASAGVLFHRVVERGLADSAIVVNAAGLPLYPSANVARVADAIYNRADWMAARALEGWNDFRGAAAAYAEIAKTEHDASIAARAAQARIRCLMRSGDKRAAVRAVEESFGGGRLASGVDPTGRLIAADALLLAVQLNGGGAAARLTALLNDYRQPLPSGQRLFLMEELRASAAFPTYAAERLAARFLEGGRTQPGEEALSPGGLPGIWKLTVPGVIALYREATIVSATQALGAGLDVTVSLTPPGSAVPAAEEWTPAGWRLPAWQISLAPVGGEQFDAVARRQTTSYIWVGLLAIASVAVGALAAGQAFRRHWQIARLKIDPVAAVSHELKTPLTSMRALVDALLEDDKPDADKTREYLELIARENLRLSRLIENFLTFSRLERRKQRFEFAAAEPARVVQSALDAMQERLHGPECRLEVSVSPGLPSVHADEDALVTVLVNLLDNAYKYTPGEKRIVVRAFYEEGGGGRKCLVFAVEDNGIGIAVKERKRIFQRFYQVDRRLTRETGGCGLGLSIVEFIVKAHGGFVRVESNPGEGSRFSVVLP
jgi:signal transduction histidine kinase